MKKHRAVFDVKKIACVSHSSMFHRLRQRCRQAQTAKGMALEIASGEQERDDSQKEKDERNEVYIRFFDGIPVHRVWSHRLLIGTINMRPLSFVADEGPSRESNEKGAGQIKKLMGKELYGNKPGDQPSIPMK